jgi:hypothetical protein
VRAALPDVLDGAETSISGFLAAFCDIKRGAVHRHQLAALSLTEYYICEYDILALSHMFFLLFQSRLSCPDGYKRIPLNSNELAVWCSFLSKSVFSAHQASQLSLSPGNRDF